MVISPRVTSPNHSDFSSLSALLGSPRFAGKTGEELAVAIWEFIVDEREGVYHFWPALERATGRTVWDPLKILNCFGCAICGQNANLLAVLWKAAGFKSRICGIKGHVVPEVFYEGAWHLLDGDLKAYHRKHPPAHGEIASVADCAADPTLVSGQQNPSRPFYLPDRSPEKMAALYDVDPGGGPPFDDRAHTMDFILRPGERLERHCLHDDKWIWFANYTQSKDRYGREWQENGPWERHGPHRTFGNGEWIYEPDLTDRCRDFEAGVLEAHGVRTTDRGLAPVAAGRQWADFEFNSPWVFTGTPARAGNQTPRDGCLLEAVVSLASASSTARIRMAVDPDLPWFTVWESRRRGRHKIELDLTERVVNSYRYLLRFEFDAARKNSCRLEALRVVSSFMLAPPSLGRLIEGGNPMTVRFGDAHGERTRRWVIQTHFGHEAELLAKTHRLENLRFDPDSEDRIAPADPERDYEVVFKIEAPSGGRLRRVYAFGSFRCKAPDDAAKEKVAAYVSESQTGPWRKLFVSEVLADRNRWHFSAAGEAALGRSVRSAFVKFVGKVGMNSAKVRVHWVDPRVKAVRTPVVIRHLWEEASGCCKMHTHRVKPSRKPQPYQIICGRGPKLLSLLMAVDSVRA